MTIKVKIKSFFPLLLCSVAFNANAIGRLTSEIDYSEFHCKGYTLFIDRDEDPALTFASVEFSKSRCVKLRFRVNESDYAIGIDEIGDLRISPSSESPFGIRVVHELLFGADVWSVEIEGFNGDTKKVKNFYMFTEKGYLGKHTLIYESEIKSSWSFPGSEPISGENSSNIENLLKKQLRELGVKRIKVVEDIITNGEAEGQLVDPFKDTTVQDQR